MCCEITLNIYFLPPWFCYAKLLSVSLWLAVGRQENLNCVKAWWRKKFNYKQIIYVPSCQLLMYFFCSSVISSNVTFKSASWYREIISSISAGSWMTPTGIFPLFLTAYSHASACPQKLVAMTALGCPSAAARLINRPSPKINIFLPFNVY